MRHVAWLAASVLLTGCVVAPSSPRAQTHYPSGGSQSEVREAPSIAGRLSVAQGDVRIWRTDEDGDSDWDDAEVNDVLTSRTQLRTGNDARAEVRFGPHALRLDEHSELVFEQLDDHHTTVRLERGTLTVRLHNNEFKDTLAVQSGDRNIELRSPGRYRLDGSEASPLRVTSFRGEAIVYTGGNTLSLREGRSLDISPDGAQLNYGEAVATAFDEWSLKRDERLRDVASTRYVSPYMTGYEDLDAHGDWVNDATYGTVWVPRVVVAGWAPYRHGRWRWVSPWGWTWVDEAPWGFAPFHYGRWVYVGTRWCWWPGTYVARPVYAPALVGWVGRPGFSASITVGSPGYVGWYPLAPWHPYQPRISNVRLNPKLNEGLINRPPAGVSLNANLERGGTAVPGRGFREPIHRGGGAPIDRVMPVRELQPVAPPARFVRGPGEVRPPRNDAAPRPQFDRDIRLPERQPGVGAAVVQPQQPVPQPQGRSLEQNLPGRPQLPRAEPVPGARVQPPDAAGWRGDRRGAFPDRSEPVMTPPQPQTQPQWRGGNPNNRDWPARPQQQQQQQQQQPQPQWQQPQRGGSLNTMPQAQPRPQPQTPAQVPEHRGWQGQVRPMPAPAAPAPQAQPQPQWRAAQPQPQQQQAQPDKDHRQRGDRGERSERGMEMRR